MMKKKREFWADIFACVMLTTGICLGIGTTTRFSESIWTYLVLALIPVLLIAAAHFHMKLFLEGCGVLVLISLGAAVIMWRKEGAFQVFMIRMAQMERQMLQLAMVCGIFALLFIAVRYFFIYPAAAAGAAVFIGAIGYQNGGLPLKSLCTILSALIFLFPRMQYTNMIKADPENRKIDYGSMQFITIPLAIFGVVLANAVVPQDATAWKVDILANTIDDIFYAVEGPFSNASPYFSDFKIKETGYMPMDNRLGGDVATSQEHVLTLRSEETPIWLKGRVSDYYTGYSWRDGEHDGDFRYGGLFWRKYQETAFEENLPLGGREAEELYYRITANISYDLLYPERNYNTIFLGGKPTAIGLAGLVEKEAVYFDIQSEMYLHRRVPANGRVRVKGRRFLREEEAFDENIIALEKLLEATDDKEFGRIAERYTRLPEEYPEDMITEVLREIAVEGLSPYETARAIEIWLADNCTYTTTPGAPDEERDFVAYFLETREGYCTYYASAMSVLAKAAGLPSRYITGFSLPSEPEENGSWYIRNSNAHAWSEVYFAGIGWVAFDPLMWSASQPAQISAAQTEYLEQESEVTAIETEPSSDIRGAEPAEYRRNSSGRIYLVFLVLGIAAAGTLFLLKIFPLLTVRHYTRKYILENVLKNIEDPAGQIHFYFQDIRFLLSLLGVVYRKEDTYSDFAQKADRTFKYKIKMRTLIQVQIRMKFRGDQPVSEEILQVAAYHQALEEEVRASISIRKYTWRRIRKNINTKY